MKIAEFFQKALQFRGRLVLNGENAGRHDEMQRRIIMEQFPRDELQNSFRLSFSFFQCLDISLGALTLCTAALFMPTYPVYRRAIEMLARPLMNRCTKEKCRLAPMRHSRAVTRLGLLCKCILHGQPIRYGIAFARIERYRL